MSATENANLFLENAGWKNAQAFPLAADFSSRRFTRFTKPDGTSAILMQADETQKTPVFVAIGKILKQMQIKAPEIYAALPEQGFVLMEDFGDVTFGQRLDQGGDKALLYKRAAELLAQLHRFFKPAMIQKLGLPVFDCALFVKQADLFMDGYFARVKKGLTTTEERESFCSAWSEVLRPVAQWPQTLMLRDFMPDNLMDLPDGGTGVLDFQDGGLGPLPYDLASLCETVRRDDGLEMLGGVVAHYCLINNAMTEKDLQQACRILSAQRHTRILGIVAQIAEKQGRKDKLAYIPRIWKTLHILLQDKALAPVKTWFEKYLPEHEHL